MPTTITASESSMMPPKNAINATKRGSAFTFRSNIQEELYIPEILCYLQPRSGSNYDEKRQIIISLLEARDKIAKKFAVVSRQLSCSFVYSLPKYMSAMDHMSNEFVARTIFKLAVLFDVYQRSSPTDNDERIATWFGRIVAAVEEAKKAARRRRDEVAFARSVMGMIDRLMKDSLATTQVAKSSNTRTSDKGCNSTADESKDAKKALRRYRTLVGVGKDKTVSRRQLVRIVSDLMRTNPTISLTKMSAALDDILGIN